MIARVCLLVAIGLMGAGSFGCGGESSAEDDRPWRDVARQIELLESGDARVRALAAANLGRLGDEALSAVPQLERLRDDPDEHVRSAAEAALRRIRDEE